MNKNWALEREDFDHLIMLGIFGGNGLPGSTISGKERTGNNRKNHRETQMLVLKAEKW